MAWYDAYERAERLGACMHIRHAQAQEAAQCDYCLQVRAAELNIAPLSAMAGGGVQ